MSATARAPQTPRTPKKKNAGAQDIVLITGANAGLGHTTALTLVKKGVLVVLGCRNLEAAKESKQDLLRLTGCPPEQVIVLDVVLDLSDLSSVRGYAAALRVWLSGRKLTSLVNNAGVGASPWGTRHHEKSGTELCFGTNHLGHFLLTILLLPVISSSIVNVSSEVHDPAVGTPFPDASDHWPSTQEAYDSVLLKGSQVGTDSTMKASERCYARSKLCNVLFTFELARRLSGAAPAAAEPEVAAAARSLPGTAGCSLPHAKEICVTAFNPGLMLDTNFVTSAAGTAAGWVAWVLTPLLRLTVLGTIMTTAGSSGVTLARLAMGELKATAQTAVYFDKAHEKPSSEFSRSRDGLTRVAPELWAHSVRWAGLTQNELTAAGLTGGW